MCSSITPLPGCSIGPIELDADGFVIIDQEVFDEDTGHMLTARDADNGCRYPLDEWEPIVINVAGCPSLGPYTDHAGRGASSGA